MKFDPFVSRRILNGTNVFTPPGVVVARGHDEIVVDRQVTDRQPHVDDGAARDSSGVGEDNQQIEIAVGASVASSVGSEQNDAIGLPGSEPAHNAVQSRRANRIKSHDVDRHGVIIPLCPVETNRPYRAGLRSRRSRPASVLLGRGSQFLRTAIRRRGPCPATQFVLVLYSSHPNMPLAPGARLGPYEIVAPIGAGPSTLVWNGR